MRWATERRGETARREKGDKRPGGAACRAKFRFTGLALTTPDSYGLERRERGTCFARNQVLSCLVRDKDPIRTRRDTDMGDTGKKDKGRREQQKKAKLTAKEKRQQKKDKKNA